MGPSEQEERTKNVEENLGHIGMESRRYLVMYHTSPPYLLSIDRHILRRNEFPSVCPHQIGGSSKAGVVCCCILVVLLLSSTTPVSFVGFL